MQFVRIGSKIVNLDMVAQIDVHDDGITVYYGVSDTGQKPMSLRLFNPEAFALMTKIEQSMEQIGGAKR